jgi:hypothetical protein
MTHYLGLCDFCRVALSFTSAEARADWEANHPCEGRDE